MADTTLMPLHDSDFSFSATRVILQAWPSRVISNLNPVHRALLNTHPIVLRYNNGQREIINMEMVAYELKKRPKVGSYMAYELAAGTLPVGAEDFIRLIYGYFQPCYLLPTKKGETTNRRQKALNRLKSNPLVQQFITETVFPGANPLQRSTVFRLFNGNLSYPTVENDLAELRRHPLRTENGERRNMAAPEAPSALRRPS